MNNEMMRMFATYNALRFPLVNGLPANGKSGEKSSVILCSAKPFAMNSGYEKAEPHPSLIVEFDALFCELWIDFDDEPDTLPANYTQDEVQKYAEVFSNVAHLQEYMNSSAGARASKKSLFGTYVMMVPQDKIVAIYPAVWDLDDKGLLFINRGSNVEVM